MALKFAHCQKQVGGADCGLFTIAFATAIAFGKPPSKLKLVQQELRSHLVNCFNKGKMSVSLQMSKLLLVLLTIYVHTQSKLLIN